MGIEYFYMRNKKKPELGFHTECRSCAVKRSMKVNYNNYERHKDGVKKSHAKPHRKEQRRQYAKEYRENGRLREWQRNNSDKTKSLNETRRHKNHKISKAEWKACKEYFNNTCAYCGVTEQDHRDILKQDLHKEHAIHNGANDLSNCIPSCKVCNSEKRTDNLEEWYNFDNIKFHPDRCDKILKWLNEDYKLYIKTK